jgi:hypothetical protein
MGLLLRGGLGVGMSQKKGRKIDSRIRKAVVAVNVAVVLLLELVWTNLNWFQHPFGHG